MPDTIVVTCTRCMPGPTCQHKHLRPVVLDVIRSVSQLLSALHGVDEGESISRTSPVSVRFPGINDDYSDSCFRNSDANL